jgi:subtilisin-like proprotein convertase family protein
LDVATGLLGCCTFTITVNAYTGPVLSSLACNDLVQISVDENCEAIIGADQILEGGPYFCYDDYLVYIDQYGFGNDINGESLTFSFGLHNVTVTDPTTGNSCWGQVLIEDKLPPTIVCVDYTLSCGESTDPVFTPPIMGTFVCSQFPNLPIGPALGPVTSTCLVSVPAGAEILDVNVCVDVTHSNIGFMSLELISPSGDVTMLWGDPQGVFGQCFFTANMQQTFDDEGPAVGLCATISASTSCDLVLQPVALQVAPAFGLPSPSLVQYNTGNPNGTWTLRATQSITGGNGTLDFWSLTIEYAQNAPFAPVVDDNCDNNPTLTFNDVLVGDLCDTTQILRTWTATDASGSSTQCVQVLTIEPLDLDDLLCPPNYEGECGESTDPSVTGWPTVDGVEVVEGGICNIFVGYWDKVLADCGNGTKIIRTWTILDWCSQEVEECFQIIKLADEEGPILVCPPDQTVGSDPWFCNADVVLLVPSAVDACGTPFTMTPSVSAGILVHFGGNFWRVDNLPVGTHTVTWTATDACGNISTCTYDITVVDDVPPVPLCDEHTIVALTFDGHLNEGLTKIYAETFDDGSYDNCGPVTFLVRRMDSCIDFDWIGPNGEFPNNDGGLPESLDRGLTFQPWVPFACCDVGQTIMVELRVTDLSGNINSCMVEVEVQDKLPPLIICPPDITVSCDFWFDAHETDGFEPFDGLEGVFGRVLDAYEFTEFDRQYVIINDPGNPQLPQPFHWGLDGWADDNCDVTVDVRTRIFDDCSGEDLPGGGPAFAVRLVERTFRAQDAQGNTSTCRQRIWVVDFDPFFITDTQCGLNNADDVRWPCDLVLTDCPEGELTPENLSAFAPNNRPIVNDDNCSLIGVTYEDQIFYFVDNACFKIVRTWTVIDWCQFELDGQGGHLGYWTYVQVIKVHDNEGPEFLDCPDGPLTYCVEDSNVALPANNQVFLGEEDPNSSSCSVHVWESRTVVETCSDVVIYDVKIYPFNGVEFVQIVDKTTIPVDSNGQAVLTWDTRQNSLPSNHPIRRYGLPYNDRLCSNWPFPGGEKDYHRVLWSVEDGCGNLSTCEYLFRLEDCKKPSPVCVGLSSVVMPTTGSVTIWAKDFDASSFDDCTPHDLLLFSFSGTTYEPSRNFDCDAIAANGSPSFLVEIWVGDEGNDQNCSGRTLPLLGPTDTTGIQWNERNKDFCTSFIVIDDNEGVCGDSLTGGLVETEEFEAVEKVTVKLTDQNGQVMNTYVTDKDGLYHFINPLFDYTIEPSRNDNHKNGVSTLDLVAMQKHLLGLQPLNSPYKLIAADANNSESVTVLDLVAVRKLILGLYTEFPNNASWRFVDASFEFEDPTHPWPFDEIIESHSGMTMKEDFVGVKVGDVNGTVTANASQITTRGARNILKLQIEDREVQEGETIHVPVTSENYEDMLGYQFTMNLSGLNYAGIEAGAIKIQPEYVGVHPSAITMSWGDTRGLTASDDETLFTLQFVATATGRLKEMISVGSQITEAEAYTTDGEEIELLDVTLVFGSTETDQVLEFALYQNEPNPFADQTVIGFDLPEAMPATLTLYDMSGKVVHVVEGEYSKGYNEVSLKRKDVVAGGAYYYHLQAGDFTASKKMILSK